MAEIPPLVRDQRKADADHLRLLSIFHYIGAGLATLGLGFLALHYLFLHAFLDNPDMWRNQKGGVPPPKEFFALFKWFYVIFGAWLVASGIANLLSGVFLGRRKHRTFSLVVAGINCVHIPLGTVSLRGLLTEPVAGSCDSTCHADCGAAAAPALAAGRRSLRRI